MKESPRYNVGKRALAPGKSLARATLICRKGHPGHGTPTAFVMPDSCHVTPGPTPAPSPETKPGMSKKRNASARCCKSDSPGTDEHPRRRRRSATATIPHTELCRQALSPSPHVNGATSADRLELSNNCSCSAGPTAELRQIPWPTRPAAIRRAAALVPQPRPSGRRCAGRAQRAFPAAAPCLWPLPPSGW